MRRKLLRPELLALSAALSAALCALAGCGGGGGSGEAASTPLPAPAPIIGYAGASFAGKVLAGQSALTGATVQLYASGTAGNGSPATALLSSPLITDATGTFQVPAGYPCPAANSQLYAVARGGILAGNSVASSPAIALMVVLGPCNTIAATSRFIINEATTVAAVYTLSQFLAPGAGLNLGATATNLSGFANAVALAEVLTGTGTGISPGPAFGPNGSSPAPNINTLANLLHGCVAGAGSSACPTLFSAATPPGASAPNNTLDALLNLVRNPATNVAALFALANANLAFTPALATQPQDWTLAINYSGGGMAQPTSLGVDSTGNIWVASYFGAASLFSPVGRPLLSQGITGFGLSASYGLAVDAADNAWITNQPGLSAHGNSVTVLAENGQSLSGATGFTSGGLDFPVAVAIDTDSTAWVVDYGDSRLTHLSSSGQALSGTAGYTSPMLAFPVAAALDAGHNLWVANQAGDSVTRVAPDGSLFTNYACCDGPSGLALDRLGNVWVANFYGDSVSQISASGTIVSNGAYTGGGLNRPQGIAVDGAGDLWLANFRGPSLTKLAGATSPGGSKHGTPLSPPSGFGADAALSAPYALAIDAAGNLWVTNSGTDLLTEFVGLAPPVKTPLLGPPSPP